MDEQPTPAPVIEPGYTFGTVTDKISSIVLTRPTSNGWFLGFGVAFLVTMGLLYAIGYLFLKGVGIWGVNIPVGWGFAIVNFVWWIGIGHAGTLISAILLLLRQSWRNSINRFAEAMTLFAVACAGMFPVLHLGRPWLAYWLFPYPNTMNVWPPLVLSVHTVVSFDFAIGQVPGWHTTIFPPYFVAGAIYSGFAMVLMLAIPIRKFYGLEDFITERHLNNSAKVMLATGLIVAYGYGIEAFMGWYGGNRYDAFLLWNRLHGPYSFFYYMLLLCNIGIPQVLWIKRLRTSPFWLFLISGVVLVGMWLERFIIVVVSLQRDFLTSSWGMYYPTRWDWMTFIGTIGFFLACMFLFLRVLPMISIFEMRTLLPEAEVKE
ncbi:MAG: hydrogenase [Acidobacteria bacterium]|nr:MAG: hydrogenase [Acidobacteriota bacterium]